MKTVRILHFLSAVMLGIILNGCATVDQKINLRYVPNVTSVGVHKGDIVVSRIDLLSRQQSLHGDRLLGSLNNAHGVRQADLLSDRSAGEWVTEALLTELKRAGYSATFAATMPAGTSHGVTVTDIRTFLDVDSGAVTAKTRHELILYVDIIIHGEKRKTLTISSRDNQTVALEASREKKEQIMLQSLQEAMQKLLPEIIALFSKT